ncbi:MAG: glycosyltransferase, partial [Candidatus Micrarchaeota archaeon]|nr:glycosyltransferase [Candidatus Micrarchaeota archaeon]
MLLSICIPTYNRPERIRLALARYEGIFSKNNLAGKVELCISDNTPANATRSLVEKFARTSKFTVRYHQNKENLGYDRNAMLALGMARGTYAHLVSDEELYSEKRLLELIGMLESEAPDCIILSGHMPARLKISGTIERWQGMADKEILRRM